MAPKIDLASIVDSGPVEPVLKNILVRATPDRAFQVFTSEMDSWWPRTHHIGSSPMAEVVVEQRAGGRIYTNQEDGSECQWGDVLVWDPPHRFVMAWRVSTEWKFEEALSHCSEIEVRFTATDGGETLVELTHRNFERHGSGYTRMRDEVNADGGWGSLLQMFARKVEENHA